MVFFADLTSFVSADDVEVCDILPPISLSGKSSQHQKRKLRKHKAAIFSNSSRFVQLSNHGKTTKIYVAGQCARQGLTRERPTTEPQVVRSLCLREVLPPNWHLGFPGRAGPAPQGVKRGEVGQSDGRGQTKLGCNGLAPSQSTGLGCD